MGLTPLIANLIHGFVALGWTAGLRRMAGPIAPDLWSDILALSLVVPVVVAVARVLGVPIFPEAWSIVRVDRWAELIRHADVAFLLVFGLLLGGTVAIFVIQELVPAWRSRRGRLRGRRERDARLDASLQRVLECYRTNCHRIRYGRPPRVLRLEIEHAVAGLQGVVAPVVLISAGLMERLDDEELDAVLAHELAHLFRGGNLGELVVWVMRALQAPSPAALIIFRSFYEAEEAACDALAASATRRPMALAAVLLKVHGRRYRSSAGRGGWRGAWTEVYRHAEIASTQARVRALLDHRPTGLTSRGLFWSTAAILGVLLWAIA